jgi:hypothetical protein
MTLSIDGVGGTSNVTYTDWDYCVGTGLGDGGTGLGGDPDDPGDDPIPDPPPGGWPDPPVGGTRPFGIYDIPAEGGINVWNSTVKRVTRSNIINILNAGGTGEMKLMLTFSDTDLVTDGSGTFRYELWQALVDECADDPEIDAAIAAAIVSGVLWCWLVIDEPNRPDRWGGEIPFATVERMCNYLKSKWPTGRTLVRISPTLDWWRRVGRHMVGCDTVWAEYLKARGTIAEYLTANLARCEDYDHDLIVGLHYGAYDHAGTTRYITPAELRLDGMYMASQTSSRIVGMSGWKYYSGLIAQAGFFDAEIDVRDEFASHDPP